MHRAFPVGGLTPGLRRERRGLLAAVSPVSLKNPLLASDVELHCVSQCICADCSTIVAIFLLPSTGWGSAHNPCNPRSRAIWVHLGGRAPNTVKMCRNSEMKER